MTLTLYKFRVCNVIVLYMYILENKYQQVGNMAVGGRVWRELKLGKGIAVSGWKFTVLRENS